VVVLQWYWVSGKEINLCHHISPGQYIMAVLLAHDKGYCEMAALTDNELTS